jgi:hypothetical protein
MGRVLKVTVGANLVLAAVVVFAWIGYASWAGLPIDRVCMGFRKVKNEKPWHNPVAFETVVLVLFGFRRYIGERRVRLIIGSLSVWSLLFTFVLPILQSQVYGTEFYSFDRALWWYACFSSLAYALVGSHRPDDERPALAFG